MRSAPLLLLLSLGLQQVSLTAIRLCQAQKAFRHFCIGGHSRPSLGLVGLTSAQVETARFEELLSRPELHEALDLVSIRAVRIETRTLNTLQAFLRPGGKLLLFRGSSKSELEDSPPPPLAWMATYPLVDALHSKLVIHTKHAFE